MERTTVKNNSLAPPYLKKYTSWRATGAHDQQVADGENLSAWAECYLAFSTTRSR